MLRKILKAIGYIYYKFLLQQAINEKPSPIEKGTMETDTTLKPVDEANVNINVGNHIISIIFTLHNIAR